MPEAYPLARGRAHPAPAVRVLEQAPDGPRECGTISGTHEEPVVPSSTRSRIPPTAEASTGTALAAASRIDIGQLSHQVEGSTATLACCSSAASVHKRK